ncbi:CAVP-target protein-like [Centruroides sculpturatus]|uniref:CAVP-target protein-like n=1 Tax=Centruroides sculpturatus TaxID=218467 RepID=UPI000C6D14BC|nr:CAVP-target protein-like [Centruroides sculpturatus]
MSITIFVVFSIWIISVASDISDNNNVPKIQPFNFPPNLSVGQKTKFLCTLVEGADPVNFRWFKDGQEITSNKNIEITYHKDMSILLINSININDAGNYTCTASNNFGSTNHTSLLAVEAPPRWLMEPQDIDVKVGVSIQIECFAAGYPTPKIVWKKISETGKRIESLGIQYGNSTLTISSVESEDGGNYVCKAENEIGQIQKVIRVTVLGKIFIKIFKNGMMIAD